MGLTDRLSQNDQEGSVFDRALAMRTHRSEDAGDDAPVSVPHSESTPPVSEEDQIVPGAAIRSLLKELQTQRHFGITTPSHLFSLMHRHLLVRKGAFLVPHRDGGMIPIATAGLDRTSTFRIRLLEEETAWLGTGKSAVVLDEAKRAALATRLSRSDGRQTPRIALFPFTHLRKIVAVLVVLDSPILRMDPNVLDVIVGALSESAGRLLFDGRQRPMEQRVRTSIFRTEHLPDIIARLETLARSEGRDVESIDINLAPIIDTIMNVHPHLDRSRLLEDVLDTTALLTESAHTAVHTGSHRVSLVGLVQPGASAELIAHILTVTLSSLFGCTRVDPLPYTTRNLEDFHREA